MILSLNESDSFDQFDGKISKESLKKVMISEHLAVADDEANALLLQNDANNDGKIGFEEFKDVRRLVHVRGWV